MRPAFRMSVYVAVVAVTFSGVYAATRASAPTPSGHDHQAIASVGETTRPLVISDGDARRIGVTYATASLGELHKEVRTVGQIAVDETRLQAISAKFDGWVEQLIINSVGQLVVAGQPVMRIYSPMLIAAQEELLLAKRLETDVSEANADARQRASDLLLSARRRLSYLDIPDTVIAEIERTGVVRRALTLRSSASGYVLEKNIVAGQKIVAGDALYRVADLQSVWADGEVFEQDLANVRVGQNVVAEFQALPGESRVGRISYIYPTLNPETRTVRLRVVLSNSDLRLKPGMYATLRITGTERAGVLTVPRSAVLSTGERSIVFVRETKGQLTPREVALGVSTDERTEILRGLSAGETVVASATFLVDAESNLGTALGGMGNMPGMELTTPPKPLPAAAKKE